MAQTTLNVRMDENVKKQFDYFCSEIGMNPSVAVNLFAKAVIREQRIPFELSLNIPNSETLSAINDVNNNKNLSKSFDSVAELMEDLNA